MQLDDGSADRGLVIDPLLLSAWDELRLRGVELRGLAGEVSEDSARASVVVVTDRPIPEAAASYFRGQLDDVLEAKTELLTLDDDGADGADLTRLLRQWVDQAAQGTGRGVRMDVVVPEDGAPIRVSVQALDSSARELTMRLASRNEPALAALECLLGGRPVVLMDVDELG